MKLVFKPRDIFGDLDKDGIQARHDFPNGYGVSVIRGFGTYGVDDGLYELGVMRNGYLCYDTPITPDVVGYLTLEEAEELADQVAALPELQNDLSTDSSSSDVRSGDSVVSGND